ncbi:MAG: exo-alpha-sialidase [Candidatus Marinimicrobia bacterium]|nr:exo-alpha-sialidase [Candidatus Neomarinimicrobiota bacterium]
MKTYNPSIIITIILTILVSNINLTGSEEYQVDVIRNEFLFHQAPFDQCHASSLVELENGEILAVWFGGTHERHPDVCIWGSKRDHIKWSEPVVLADGFINDSLRYPTWNPVLFKTSDNRLYLFYKVGPSPSEWWGVFKTSDNNGDSWSAPVKLQNGLPGPVKNKPVYLSNGRILSPSSVEKSDHWQAHIEISDDDGKSWSKAQIEPTTGYKLIQPTLLTLKDGTILALMRSNQNCIVESRSKDLGNSWSKPKKTSVLNPNSGIDNVTLKNGLQVLVYNPASSGKEWFEGRSRLYLAVSTDGNNWRDVYKLEDHGSGEYSYPAVIESEDGHIHITYTHDRKTINYVVLKITLSK